MKFPHIALITGIVLIIASLLIGAMLMTQRVTTIYLELHCPTETTDCNISQESVEKLSKILQANNSAADKETILEVINDERGHFSIILASLTFLTALFGLFAISRALISRAEQDELKRLISESQLKLAEIEYASIITDISGDKNEIARREGGLYLMGRVIDTKEDFQSAIIHLLTNYIRKISALEMLDRFLTKDHEHLFALLMAMVHRAHRDNYLANPRLDATQNFVFDQFLYCLRSNLSKEQFETFQAEIPVLAAHVQDEPVIFEKG